MILDKFRKKNIWNRRSDGGDMDFRRWLLTNHQWIKWDMISEWVWPLSAAGLIEKEKMISDGWRGLIAHEYWLALRPLHQHGPYGVAFGLNKRGRGIYDWDILEREHRAFVFLCSSTMDSCWTFARWRFRIPFLNPRVWGEGRGWGDSSRLATSTAGCSSAEIDGAHTLGAQDQRREKLAGRGVSCCWAERWCSGEGALGTVFYRPERGVAVPTFGSSPLMVVLCSERQLASINLQLLGFAVA
jgi:hypothetical protein